MANPSPTSVYVPAFDVTVGTADDNPITFGIVGGTEIVRSNRLYIYDISDNSLICSHLYVSTLGVHEFPAKTDSSIIYASGKSAADLTNGTQYYAKIQTFTNVAATEGASGLSNAVVFWALNTPTATFEAIPNHITTSSYNVAVNYSTNLSSDDDTLNIIQQYQFTLYRAGGVKVAQTDIIIGNGEWSVDHYIISHNFTGLDNLTTYYVECEILSTEGMVLNVTSTPFYVNTTSFRLDAATAINDPCGGYITVIANLSDQYTSNINRVLVKRKDAEDPKAQWITLASIPVNRAADMDFIHIDFYNRYGDTYVYAIVPVLTQVQYGVVVDVEGGYTESPAVFSIFEGVYVADATGIQKFVAGVGYGNGELHQAVGVIETIGNRYPVIVSNSNMNYHTGEIMAYAFGEGLYKLHWAKERNEWITSDNEYVITSNGEFFAFMNDVEVIGSLTLDRNEMVELRKTIEAFLTNKKPKVLKDWNGNIWLVMFTGNITLEWSNDWGMGLVTFIAPWTEIGQADDQTDLENYGLINLGGE